jgi:hypothetical protein
MQLQIPGSANGEWGHHSFPQMTTLGKISNYLKIIGNGMRQNSGVCLRELGS